jgi:hypothetical protein
VPQQRVAGGGTTGGDLMPLIVLWVSAATFATFGMLFFVNPAGWAASVDVSATTSTARTEIRAMYGGLEIGIAALLVWCALDPRLVRIGLLAVTCMFGGLAAGRAASLLLETGARSIMYSLVAIEAVAAGLALIAFRQAGRA